MFDFLRSRLAAHGPWPRRVLALTCLLLAAAAAIPHAGPARAAPGSSVPVVVARGSLDAGRRLAARDVEVRRYPADVAPAGAVRSVAVAAGRRLAAPVGRGEPLTPQRLLGPALTAHLPPGSVAVSVEVADGDAAQLVHAGDLVDLVPTGDGRPGDSVASTDTGTGAGTVADAVRVLAVLPGAPGDATSETPVDASTAQAVLVADRRTAIRIADARGIGPFTLLVRGP